MRYRTLGRTGLRVSAVSLGGLFFGKLAGGRDTAATVAAAADLGISLIDTAMAYDGSEFAARRTTPRTWRRTPPPPTFPPLRRPSSPAPTSSSACCEAGRGRIPEPPLTAAH